ncbi:hypothetical protein [Thiolapillus sp.]
MSTFNISGTPPWLTVFLLLLCSTIPVQARDASLPITQGISSARLAEAPWTVTVALFENREAIEPIQVQSFERGQWRADIDLNDWPPAREQTIRFQTQLTGIEPARAKTLWAEMSIDGVPAGTRFPLAAGANGISTEGLIESRSLTDGGFKFPDGSIQTTAVDAHCPAGSSIRSISPDGVVACETISDSGGDITAVVAGAGLGGGATSGDATLTVDTTAIQKRVTGACPGGSSIRSIDESGNVTCEADDNTGGDITSVTAGTGLVGGGASGGVTLGVNIPLHLIGSVGLHKGIIQGTNTSSIGYGVKGNGGIAGGYFENSVGSGYANVGISNTGIMAYGNSSGGYFKDSDGSGWARVGSGDSGIRAYGNTSGGYFKDWNGSGYADVGIEDTGIKAYGNTSGGYFEDLDGSDYAWVAYGGHGIKAYGNDVGGHFEDLDGSGYADVGIGDTGIKAYGSTSGGYFKDSDNSGYADVGFGNTGIRAFGNSLGGYFKDLDNSGFARVAIGDTGIRAYGNTSGGYFEDTTSGNYARVGYSSYKIYGTGTVNFVQNHPENSDEVIVYTAPEGDEVATYTRGSAKLVNGEARIPLGETFQWVTNPDIGLTAHLTPKGGWAALYVASLNTREMVVKAAAGSDGNAAFDYLVYGLRIGFEDTLVVQKKTREARIPSMEDHRRQFDEHPQMRQYTALSRYARMQDKDRESVLQNMAAATALLQAVEEYDPQIHKRPAADH